MFDLLYTVVRYGVVVLVTVLVLALTRRKNDNAPHTAHTRSTFAVITDGVTIDGDITNMNLRAGQKILLRARPTHKGKPAKYQVGSATLVNTLPEDFFKVLHDPTGNNELEVLVIALEESGDEELPAVGVVALEIDADPTEEVRMLRPETAVNWVPFGASTFEFDAGTPENATDEELAVDGDDDGAGEDATVGSGVNPAGTEGGT
jgi:hypothetical protein